MSAAIHVIFDIHMGASHVKLGEMVQSVTKRSLKTGESCVFLNKSWTSCKILYPDGLLLYWRSPNGSPIGLDAIRYLPTHAAKRLTLTGKSETSVLKEFEVRFSRKITQMKLAYA